MKPDQGCGIWVLGLGLLGLVGLRFGFRYAKLSPDLQKNEGVGFREPGCKHLHGMWTRAFTNKNHNIHN